MIKLSFLMLCLELLLSSSLFAQAQPVENPALYYSQTQLSASAGTQSSINPGTPAGNSGIENSPRGNTAPTAEQAVIPSQNLLSLCVKPPAQAGTMPSAKYQLPDKKYITLDFLSYWLLTAVIPGMGQTVNGYKHGLLITAAFEAAGLYYYTLCKQYNAKLDVYNKMSKDFHANPTGNKWQNLVALRDKLKAEEEDTKTGLYTLLGVYVFNIFDAVVIKTHVDQLNMSCQPNEFGSGLCMSLNVKVGL